MVVLVCGAENGALICVCPDGHDGPHVWRERDPVDLLRAELRALRSEVARLERRLDRLEAYHARC